MPMRGHTAPRCSVTNSTFPAAVTAASSATASPPRPEEALGGPPGRPSMPTPTADGHTCKQCARWGRHRTVGECFSCTSASSCPAAHNVLAQISLRSTFCAILGVLHAAGGLRATHAANMEREACGCVKLTENVVTLCGRVCSRPSRCGLVVLVAAGAAALAVLDGTVMLNAVGIMVGAGGNAGAEVSSSNKLCKDQGLGFRV